MAQTTEIKTESTGVFARVKKEVYDSFLTKLIQEGNAREEVIEGLMNLYSEKGEECLIFKKSK